MVTPRRPAHLLPSCGVFDNTIKWGLAESQSGHGIKLFSFRSHANRIWALVPSRKSFVRQGSSSSSSSLSSVSIIALTSWHSSPYKTFAKSGQGQVPQGKSNNTYLNQYQHYRNENASTRRSWPRRGLFVLFCWISGCGGLIAKASSFQKLEMEVVPDFAKK